MAATTLGRLISAGFPLLRRAPLTVLGWGVCLLPLNVFSTMLSGVYEGLKGPWSYIAPGPGGAWLQFGVLVFNLLVTCLAMAILAAAVFRAIADPDRSDGRWMRIGADEFRLGLVWGLIFVVTFTGVFLIAFGAAAAGRNGEWATKSSTLIGALILAAVWMARFVLAPAMTVFEGRMAVVESWRMTRGRYGVAIACALLFLVAYGGSEWLLSALGDLFKRDGLNATIGDGPFVIELARYAAKPENLVPDLTRAVAGTVGGVIAFAPMAVLYRDLSGRNPADQAAVFD